MISVIIPVYNVAKYLDQCIESIINQSYSYFECILVDDGSTDGSGDICDTWAEKDSRIKVYHQENQGVSATRNFGIKKAKGEYIYFIDADDIINQNIFNNIPASDLILGSYEIVYNDHIIKKEHSKNYLVSNYALSFLKEDIKACIGSFIVNKRILIKNNIIFNPTYKYGEDLEFILKVIMASQSIIISDDTFVKYIQHSNNTMNTYSLSRYDVFFSRLELIQFAQEKNNTQVVGYLSDFSLIESIIEVTNCLILNKFSIKVIRTFFNQNPVIYEVIYNNKQSKYSIASKILNLNIYLYALWLFTKYYLKVIKHKFNFSD